MPIPDSFLQELTDRSDIVDVVSTYVKLNKRSGSNLFGLCPFHSEKTGSFSVSSDKQIYYCFGCGKGGGVINFIMEIEGLNFHEAVEFLARRAGLEVPQDAPDINAKRRERMLALNKEAAKFFYSELIGQNGKPAVDYVNRREISPTMVKNFGLGFAPNSWDSLLKAMTQKGYSLHEMADAGLVRAGKKQGSFYDTFRNRLMFPVIDIRGNVIGFSGRILDDGEPKYMNSPETLVFNKSRNLFAMNLAKKTKEPYIILAEGNIDVVAMHGAGFNNAVASLGTSLTPEQARLIARYASEVVIAYDNDNAGQKASQRAIGILEKLDIKVRLLKMTGAKDPDEFIKLNGAEVFRNLLENSENHIEYRLDALLAKYNIKSDEERVAYLKDAANLVASLQNPLEREVYSLRVAQQTNVSPNIVENEVARIRKRFISREKKQVERIELDPIKTAQPKERSQRYENIRSARAEEGIILLLIQDPALFGNNPPISGDAFSSPMLRNIYLALLECININHDVSIAYLSSKLETYEMNFLTELMNQPDTIRGDTGRALHDYIDVIHTQHSKKDMSSDLRDIAEKHRQKKGYGN